MSHTPISPACRSSKCPVVNFRGEDRETCLFTRRTVDAGYNIIFRPLRHVARIPPRPPRATLGPYTSATITTCDVVRYARVQARTTTAATTTTTNVILLYTRDGGECPRTPSSRFPSTDYIYIVVGTSRVGLIAAVSRVSPSFYCALRAARYMPASRAV